MGRSREMVSAALAGHPVVGLWSWDVSHMCYPGARSFTVFHADGTFVEANPFLHTGLGWWRATGERTADLLIVYHHKETGGDGTQRRVVTAWGPIEVDESGNAMTMLCAYDIKSLAGAVVESGSHTQTAISLTVEGMGAGTPGASTPAS